MMYPDADAVITGHVHEEWRVTYCRNRVTNKGRVYHDDQIHVCSPTYKQEYDDPNSTWHSQGGRPLKPLGGTYLTFTVDKSFDGLKQKDPGRPGAHLPLWKVVIDTGRVK